MWAEIRELFPIHNHCTYLNNAGVAPPSLRILESVDAYHRDHALHGWKKISSSYRETASQIKGILAQLLECPPSCIALTHNTSEGMNIVAQGYPWKHGDCVLGLDLEYPANVYPWWNLEKKGVRYLRLKPTHSAEDLDNLERHMDEGVRIVAVSAVDWCSGFTLNLAHLGECCRQRGVTLVVDVAQALGVIPLNPETAINLELLSAASVQELRRNRPFPSTATRTGMTRIDVNAATDRIVLMTEQIVLVRHK